MIKVGKPGEEYTTEAKEIEFYTLEKEPENKKGVMVDGDIIVNYYYYFTNPPPQATGTISQIKGNNTSGNATNTIVIGDDSSTISTGDKVLVTYTSIIIFVVFVNIIQLIISKRKNNKK